jgi:hypothetical protein
MSWTTNLRLTVLFYPITYKIRTSCLLPQSSFISGVPSCHALSQRVRDQSVTT